MFEVWCSHPESESYFLEDSFITRDEAEAYVNELYKVCIDGNVTWEIKEVIDGKEILSVAGKT